MATYDALEGQAEDEPGFPPTIHISMPGFHLVGEGTWGARINPVENEDDTYVLHIPVEGRGRAVPVFGSRKQLLQFVSELAQVVEIGPIN